MDCPCLYLATDTDCMEEELFDGAIASYMGWHTCVECKRVIPPGEEYHLSIYRGEEGYYNHIVCGDCQSLIDTYICTYYFSKLWDGFSDVVADSEADSFLDDRLAKLTPAARDHVIQIVNDSHASREI